MKNKSDFGFFPHPRQLQADKEYTMSIEMIETDGFHSGTQIKVIGVGGGGSNAVELIFGMSVVLV